ncbi:hypothetical protein D3C75_688870 [compost metagenome]
MLQPPVSDLAPWRPGHWITQAGYALNEKDLIAGTKRVPERRMDMQSSVFEVDLIIERVIAK